MKACRIPACAEGAPRNSTICLPCMKKGYKQDGTLSVGKWDMGRRHAGVGGSVMITAGRSTGSGQGGSITITAGDGAAYAQKSAARAKQAGLLMRELAHQKQHKKSKEYGEKQK